MSEDFSSCGVSRQFDDPFMLPSSSSMPTNIFNSLHWCRFLYFLNPQYRQASARVVRHFITDFDYPDIGDHKEKEELDELLKGHLQLPLMLADMGDEWSCYGNAFFRIHFPFDRFLVDEVNRCEYSLDMFREAKFAIKDMKYEVVSPKDGKTKVRLPFRDRKSTDVSRIRIRKIDPLYMTIRHNMISGANQYIYRFEQQIVADVRKGKRFLVDDMPLPMLQAIRDGNDFMFNPDQIFHFKAPTISGVQNAGWGLPNVFANYRSLHQLQVYRKIDEAIGLDYMVPFRIFTPNMSDKIGDAVNTLVLSRWTREISHIIDARRKDKFAMHALPFPVNYQEFGANGKELTPKDMMEFQTNSMLDGMGFPSELFRGTLQYMQVPTAMRLFENTFMFVNMGYTQFTQWVVRRIRSYMNQPYVKVVIQKPQMADSLERKQILLQLMSANEISRETGFDQLGIDDPIAESVKRMEEDLAIQRKQVKLQSDFQREMETGVSSTGADASGGSAVGGQGGGQGGVTPTDIAQQATDMAQYWLSIQSDGQRRQAMQSTRNANPQLYAVAKEQMEQARQQGASEGRAAVAQGAQQAPAGNAPVQ